LKAWLEYAVTSSGSVLPPVPEGRERHDTPQSIWLSFVQYEMPFLETIEIAIDKLWLHEAEAFQGLQPEAASLLRLRIATAAKGMSAA